MATDPRQAVGPNRFVFSTDQLPAEFDSRTRRRVWLEKAEENIQRFCIDYAEDIPFFSHTELILYGDLKLTRVCTSAKRMTRTKDDVARDGVDCLFLNINVGNGRLRTEQRKGAFELAQGELGLSYSNEPGSFFTVPGSPFRTAVVSREAVGALVSDLDDLATQPLDSSQPAVRLLERYLDLLYTPMGFEADPAVSAHVSRSLTDLVALALGAQRDEAELAMLRGGRAAKLRLIVAGIKAGFEDPGFSEHTLAARLGMAPRTIRDLLYQTGRTFSERVMELRLAKAHSALSDARCKHMKVAEIAYACGFNEVSYFNRCFRRRFGGKPSEFRL